MRLKKNEDVMLKKMIAETKKSFAAEKKRIHTKEIAMRKRKRKEDKAVKELKKNFEIEKSLSWSTSKFFRFNVFVFANEKNCV
jgi:hypothetical protein